MAKGLNLKFSPELKFRIDETFDRIDETQRLFARDDVRRDLERDDEDGDDPDHDTDQDD